MTLAMKVTIPEKKRKRIVNTSRNRKIIKLRVKQISASASELGRKPYKLQTVLQNWEEILITDEKLFTVEQLHNRQNVKSLPTGATGISAIVTEHRQNPQSLMIWGEICTKGKIPLLVFVPQGVKINQEVYRYDIPVVHSRVQHHLGGVEWTFQQDQLTERKQLRSGAKSILLVSSHLRNGRLIRRISIRWTITFSRFWKSGSVLNPTKI